MEFALLNPSGFFFYSVYSVGGRVNHTLGTGEVSEICSVKFPLLTRMSLGDEPRSCLRAARLRLVLGPAGPDLHLRRK